MMTCVGARLVAYRELELELFAEIGVALIFGGTLISGIGKSLSFSLHRGTGGGAGGKVRVLVIGIFFAAGFAVDRGGGGGEGARVVALRSCRGAGGGVGNFSFSFTTRLLGGEFRCPSLGPGCEASPIRPLGFFRGFCRT